MFYRTGEKEAATETLTQATVTLALLDVTGGAVVQNPWTELIAEEISKSKQFQSVKEAIAKYRDAIFEGVSSPIADQEKLIRKVLRKNERWINSVNAAK